LKYLFYIDYPSFVLNYKQVNFKIEKMDEISYVVVFPTIFTKNKIPQLITNIKKILKIKNQQFKSVKRDGDIILVDANDVENIADDANTGSFASTKITSQSRFTDLNC